MYVFSLTGDVPGGLLGFGFPWTANVAVYKIPAGVTQLGPIVCENAIVITAGSNRADGLATTTTIVSTGDQIRELSWFSFNVNADSCTINGAVSA